MRITDIPINIKHIILNFRDNNTGKQLVFHFFRYSDMYNLLKRSTLSWQRPKESKCQRLKEKSHEKSRVVLVNHNAQPMGRENIFSSEDKYDIHTLIKI